MEVILKEDVPKLGRRGDIVKVADGYGRNFLLPRRLAIEASGANVRNIEQMRAAVQRKDARDLAGAQAQAAELGTVAVRFRRRAGEHDVLFGSVTSIDIAAELARQGYEIDRRKIQLHEPIKTVGTYKVPVHLYRGVVAEVTVDVQREEQ